MQQVEPHWKSDMDYSSYRFYIRRMDTASRNGASEVPAASLPLIGFIYVTKGEVLVEADGNSYLCQAGHVLIIPAQCLFAIRYYREATGYTGAFSTSMLTDTKPLRYLTAPVHQAFWFDEGVFMGELFNMIQESFEKRDELFIEKALDLFLSGCAATPVTAAVLAFGANFLMWILDLLENAVQAEWLSEAMRFLSLYRRNEPFMMGQLSFAGILFDVSFIAAFLALTVWHLDRKRYGR